MWSYAPIDRTFNAGRRLRPRRSARRADRGLSLLELMISVSLLAIFVGAVYESVIAGLRVVSASARREEVRGQLVFALERFTREVYLADDVDDADQLEGTDTGEFQFDTPSTNNIEYTYDASADTLSRRVGSGTAQIIARYVTSFDLDYYDSAGAQLSEPVSGSAEDTIRVVRVIVTAATGSETMSVATAAYLRSM